jgi:hypothetical protein
MVMGLTELRLKMDLTVAAWGARGEDGDPYPGWREWVEGGGGGANSTTRGSGCKGGERGMDLSTVKMVRGVAPFYRVREAVEGAEVVQSGERPAALHRRRLREWRRGGGRLMRGK